jgi:hypothetical protein
MTRQDDALVTGRALRRAEGLAAEAHRLLGQGDGQATAGVWAAVAQTHAVLDLAAAIAVGASGADSCAWAEPRDRVMTWPQ